MSSQPLYLFKEERNYAIQNQDTLREVFGKSIIAVYKQVVVASGDERQEVIHQVGKKIGKRPVLISCIDDILNPPAAFMQPPLLRVDP
jgi:hypothetical protein